jgi:hypothetical protein
MQSLVSCAEPDRAPDEHQQAGIGRGAADQAGDHEQPYDTVAQPPVRHQDADHDLIGPLVGTGNAFGDLVPGKSEPLPILDFRGYGEFADQDIAVGGPHGDSFLAGRREVISAQHDGVHGAMLATATVARSGAIALPRVGLERGRFHPHGGSTAPTGTADRRPLSLFHPVADS